MRFSSKREKCLMDIVNEEDDVDGSRRLSGKNKLKEFRRTRWVERHEAFIVFIELFPKVRIIHVFD